MTETLEPRQVEKPFLGRWVRTTFALLARSPVTFGAAVVLLAILGLLYIDVVPERLVNAGFTLIVGGLLLPVFWIAMSLLSRQADRPFDRLDLLQPAAYRSVLGGGLLPGCLVGSMSWLLHWALAASPILAGVIGSFTLNCLLLVTPLGVCYFPLMIVTAIFLVFTGVFNYVAYRDIFERRLDYAAEPLLPPVRARR